MVKKAEFRVSTRELWWFSDRQIAVAQQTISSKLLMISMYSDYANIFASCLHGALTYSDSHPHAYKQIFVYQSKCQPNSWVLRYGCLHSSGK